MARIEANLAGADEALMLNDAGNVAECTADNVFVIKHGHIFTPPIAAGALRGITRVGCVRDRGRTGRLKITETDITRHDVFMADECFLTGTAAEVIPVIKADGRVDWRRQAGTDHAADDRAFREMTRETGTPIYSLRHDRDGTRRRRCSASCG